MRYLSAHAQHIGSRSYQQDFFGFAHPAAEGFSAHAGFLAVLCDGMGGMEHGDVASQTAVGAVLDAYALKTPEETIPEALERSVRFANDRVIEAALALGAKEGVGTTLIAAVVHQSSLYYFSVGDSGLFHLHDGRLQMVNSPHVFSNLLDRAAEMGRISRADAQKHPDRDSLTSFIGIQVLEEVDRNIEPWPIGEGESILLASDGLFKTLESEEILKCLNGHPQSWPSALVARTLAQRHPAQDNVTVLSVTCDSGALEEWVPPTDDGDRMENSTEGAGSSKHLSAWLVTAAFLLLVAIGIGGLWYFSTH